MGEGFEVVEARLQRSSSSAPTFWRPSDYAAKAGVPEKWADRIAADRQIQSLKPKSAKRRRA